MAASGARRSSAPCRKFPHSLPAVRGKGDHTSSLSRSLRTREQFWEPLPEAASRWRRKPAERAPTKVELKLSQAAGRERQRAQEQRREVVESGRTAACDGSPPRASASRLCPTQHASQLVNYPTRRILIRHKSRTVTITDVGSHTMTIP